MNASWARPPLQWGSGPPTKSRPSVCTRSLSTTSIQPPIAVLRLASTLFSSVEDSTMVSRRAKFLAAALVPTAVGGYLAYSVFAAQAHPEKALAQAPMNTQVQVP